MSSFPNWVLMKFAKEEMLALSTTSSWWKITSEYPAALSISTASLPLFSSLAVNITLTPFEASCLHISNPIPLLAPVTTAILKKKVWNKCKNKEMAHIKTLLLKMKLPLGHGFAPGFMGFKVSLIGVVGRLGVFYVVT
jgi:hypothetical protein